MDHMRGTARHDRLRHAGLGEPQRGQARGPAPDALAGEVEPRLEGAHVVPNGGRAPAHLLAPHESGQGPDVGPGGGIVTPVVGLPARGWPEAAVGPRESRTTRSAGCTRAGTP